MKNKLFDYILIVVMCLILLNLKLFACTMFNASKNGKTLVGNNEDWEDPYTKIWYEPAQDGKYGGVYFGYRDMIPQGGMNDQGLVCDGFYMPYLKLNDSLKKEKCDCYLFVKAMEECATVEEVIKLFSRYDLHNQGLEQSQYMFVDKKGDSIIVEGDIIHRKKGVFQVVTNFYLSLLKKSDKISCNRYKTATELLTNSEVSIETFRKVLAATHGEGDWGGTQYSNIYDVNRGLVYLYYFHNFASPVIINLSEELKKGKRSFDLPSLFQKNLSAERYLRLYKNRKRKVIKLDPKVYQQYIGKYEWSDGKPIWIKQINNRLIFIYRFIYEIFPESETKFFIKEYNAQITFVKSKSGVVTGLIFCSRNKDHKAKKIPGK